MQESRTPRENFAYRKRLIIVFSKISRAIYNCEGGGFPKEKHGLSSPAPKRKTHPSGAFFFLERLTPLKEFDFLTRNCSSRSGTLTPTYRRSLISPLKSVINAFLNGQLDVTCSNQAHFLLPKL